MIERSRTIRWEDPAAAAAEGLALSGLDYFAAMERGEIPPPPMMALMGFEPVEFGEGRVVFAAAPGEHHGMVHGGLALTMLDSAMGCAVHTTLPAGTGYISLEVKVNFVRGVRAEDGRVATAEGRLERESDGKLVAHGTTTCMILAPG